MIFVRLFLLVCVLIPALGIGQEVRFQTESYARAMRGALAESEKQGFPNWVDLLSGERGTQVHILFKVDNVDILIITPFEVSRKALLDDAKQVARKLNLPNLDFIEAEGTKTRMVDIEANDYLQRNGDISDFEWDFSALVEAIESSPSLPKPICYYVRRSDAAYTKLLVNGNSSNRDLEQAGFFTAKEVERGSRLVYHEKIGFISKAQGWFIAGMSLMIVPLALLLPWWVARMSIKFAREQKRELESGEEQLGSAEPRSPEAVQEAYLDSVKERPKLLLKILPSLAPLLFLPLLMFRERPTELQPLIGSGGFQQAFCFQS